jgi:23S rRNA (uracil1939-C5)-methyltransferase
MWMEEILIEKLAYEGFGLGHLKNGKTAFVRKSVPGDKLAISPTRIKKNFEEAMIQKIIHPSAERIQSECSHFDICGGCEMQQISYENQLKHKAEILKKMFDHAKVSIDIQPILPGSNEQFFYRNVMRYSFMTDSSAKISLAMHDANDYRNLIPIDKCLLLSERTNQIIDEILQHINKLYYSENPFKQIRFREAKFTNELMVEIFTDTNTLPSKDGITEILKAYPEIKSFYHCEMLSGDNINNVRRKIVYGSPIIYEKIGKYRFQISPDSFFQTNSFGIETLYNKVKQISEISPKDSVLDLFCGTGTIGIYLSNMANKVTGIEINQNAINDARANSRLNSVINTEFICQDADKYLSLEKQDFDVVVVDPPRTGLTKDTINNISKMNFRSLIYVSCNPATMIRDIKLFRSLGINLTFLQPIDMFPQTHHIECVGLLKK